MINACRLSEFLLSDTILFATRLVFYDTVNLPSGAALATALLEVWTLFMEVSTPLPFEQYTLNIKRPSLEYTLGIVRINNRVPL